MSKLMTHQGMAAQAELYRFARCKRAYPLQKMRKLGIPLPAEEVDVINEGVLWEDIQVGCFPLFLESASSGT